MSSQTAELNPGEIHLWLAFQGEITDASLHANYFGMLSEPERLQYGRFHFERDRLRYLVTRALARTVLSRYAPIAPAAWIFDTNAYGRPFVVNSEAGAADIHFNISHTNDVIVMAVARHRQIGVDVENICSRAASLDIARHFFASGEASALCEAPTDQFQLRFFEYWTFKESYIKARGLGLSIPLDLFSFDYPGQHRVRFVVDDELEDDSEDWQFWQFRPSPEYLVALCAERLRIQNSHVVARMVVPGASESILDPVLTRISG